MAKSRTKKEVHNEKCVINAVRKANRELEISMYGKLISTRPSKTHKSKKVYDRKKDKTKWGFI